MPIDVQACEAITRTAMAESTLELIDVSRLRVGVFVQIDLRAGEHPFQSDSFMIRSDRELAQIRALGVAQVRYSRERSEVAPLPEAGVVPSWSALGVPGFDDHASRRGADAAVGSEAPAATPEPAANEDSTSTAPAAAPASENAPSVLPAAQRKALLADQQASLDRCEHQFAETSRQLRNIFQNARGNPAQARQVASAQVEAMLGHVNGMEEVAIRLLSEKAGQETTLHAMNVSVLSILLGRALKFDAAQLAHLGLGALLHDIGKLELPDRLRWRDDHAPAVERRLFQGHAAHGLALGKKMGLPAEVMEVIAQHHEHADGSGYPSGLKGEQIKPLARVVGLVNQYDNLCNPGNPAQALTPHDALALIFARQRDAFDAAALAAFIRMMGVYPPGSVLQLNDERYAIVVSVNSDRPLKPRILVHEPAVPAEEALIVDLERHPELGVQRAVKPVQLPRAVFDYLSPRKRMCYFFERSLPASRDAAS
jgi:putative nucleotidyltransferase with HDIG domain